MTPLRLLLALLVLFGHSFAITGVRSGDPISGLLKHTWIGAVAVELFFFLSGILIAKSFVDRNPIAFVVSRVLRIYPALIVCVIVSVFAIGPLLTDLQQDAYFADPKSLSYLNNITLIHRIQWMLPGVDTAINGSLWTLPVEIRCYAALFIFGILGVFSNRLTLTLVALLLLAVGLFQRELLPVFGGNDRWLRPAAYFLIGALAFKWADQVILDWRLAVLSILVLMFLNDPVNKNWHSLSAIPLCYLSLMIIYMTPHINMDKWLGDLSYGTYIWAWPIQLICLKSFGLSDPYANAAAATGMTLVVAFVSWHVIEKNALLLKTPMVRLVAKLHRPFKRSQSKELEVGTL